MAAPALAVGRQLHYRLWPALAVVCPEEFRERHQNEVRKAEFRGKLQSNPPSPQPQYTRESWLAEAPSLINI